MFTLTTASAVTMPAVLPYESVNADYSQRSEDACRLTGRKCLRLTTASAMTMPDVLPYESVYADYSQRSDDTCRLAVQKCLR